MNPSLPVSVKREECPDDDARIRPFTDSHKRKRGDKDERDKDSTDAQGGKKAPLPQVMLYVLAIGNFKCML